MSAGWITQGELRAVQNYATNHVLLQPEPGNATSNAVGTMAATVKLFPFEGWPVGEIGTPSGHPSRASPLYYMSEG